MMTETISGDEATNALANLIVVMADNKYALGRRLAEWAAGPPTLEASVAGAAIGQQLLGNARVLYPLLENLPADGLGVPGDSGRTTLYSMSASDGPLDTWAEVVSTYFLVNSACNVMLGALTDSAYTDLAKRAQKILDDKRFQEQYGAGRVHELVGRFSGGRVLLQERVDDSFPEVLAWFGPDGEPGVRALREANFVDAANEAWRQEWLNYIGPVLREADIRIPARLSESDTWEWDEVPWTRWNAVRRRLEPAA